MAIVVHRIDGGWYADAPFAEKDALKEARWRWHPGPEPGKKRAAPAGVPDKRWWTDDPLRAAKLIAHTTGDVRAELERIIAEHETSLAASRAVDADAEIPVPEGLAYLPFQRAGIVYAAQRPSVMVCDEMGLGKTVQAIGVLNCTPTARAVLVVCPASLRLNWARELEKWSVVVRPILVAPSVPPKDFVDHLKSTLFLDDHVGVDVHQDRHHVGASLQAPLVAGLAGGEAAVAQAAMLDVAANRLGEKLHQGIVGVGHAERPSALCGIGRVDEGDPSLSVDDPSEVAERCRVGDRRDLNQSYQKRSQALGAEMASVPARKRVRRNAKLSRDVLNWLTETTAKGVGVLIINYDILIRWHHVLHAFQWDLIVLDEAHYIKNRKAKRSVEVLGGGGASGLRAKRVIALTGTPLPNRPEELFGLIHYLDPQTWPNFFTYAKRYCNAQQVGVGDNTFWDFSGATNLDELQERLRSTIMVRRLKAEVLTDLPPKTRQVIELPENGAGAAIAEEQAWWQRSRAHIEQLAVAVELAKAADDPTAYQAALDAMGEATKVAFTEMARVRCETARAKVPYVIEHVSQLLEATDKVIVFGHHKDVIGAIADHFGAEAVTITGDVALADRQAAVDRFQTDPTCRVFIGGIMAAGVGLTLTAASTVVFAELDWVPGNVTQAEDRAHRIGQRTNVLVQHLVLAGSIDAALAKAIVDKQQIADAALDTERDGALLTAPVAPLAPREQPATRNAKQREIAALAVHLSSEVCALIHSLVRTLAGMCDGAKVEDGHGFNKIDTSLGHALAELPFLTAKQAVLASRFVTFYRRQLPPAAVEAVTTAIAAAKAAARQQEAA